MSFWVSLKTSTLMLLIFVLPPECFPWLLKCSDDFKKQWKSLSTLGKSAFTFRRIHLVMYIHQKEPHSDGIIPSHYPERKWWEKVYREKLDELALLEAVTQFIVSYSGKNCINSKIIQFILGVFLVNETNQPDATSNICFWLGVPGTVLHTPLSLNY